MGVPVGIKLPMFMWLVGGNLDHCIFLSAMEGGFCLEHPGWSFVVKHPLRFAFSNRPAA